MNALSPALLGATRWRLVGSCVFVIALAAVAAVFAISVFGEPEQSPEQRSVAAALYLSVLALSSLGVLARAIAYADDRLAWSAIGLGIGLVGLAEAVDYRGTPYAIGELESPSELARFAALGALLVAVYLLTRSQILTLAPVALLDLSAAIGASVSLAAAGIGALTPRLVAEGVGDQINLLYPLSEAVVLGFLVGLLVLGRGRTEPRWILAGAALVIACSADIFYLVFGLTSEMNTSLLPIHAMWAAAGLLAFGASWLRKGRPMQAEHGAVLMSAFAGIAAVSLLAIGTRAQLSAPALLFSVCTLLIVLARLVVSLESNERLMKAGARREAELAGLMRSATRVADQQDLPEVLEATTRELAALLAPAQVCIVRVERDQEPQILEGWPAPAPQSLETRQQHALEALILRQSATSADGETPQIGSRTLRWNSRGRASAPVAVSLIRARNHLWGAVIVTGRTPSSGVSSLEVILERFALVVGMAVSAQEAREDLYRRAISDPLTGLANHRRFHERLQEEHERAGVSGDHLSLALLDIDHFKEVNDAFGHPNGDRILMAIASRIEASVRPTDLVARIGGEEFAVILPGADARQADRVVDRIRTAISGTPIAPAGIVRVSAGIADLEHVTEGSEQLNDLCDAALYWAKWNGRNRSVVYSPDEVSSLSAPEQARRQVHAQALAGLRALALAVDAKDQATSQHSSRVSELSGLIARELGWSEERQQLIREAALLHDVGKIGVPDEILLKDGKLTDDEFAQIKLHPALGARIVEEILLAEQVSWIHSHHERWDGRGYPAGLAGEKIPMGARIIAVADAWDVMTSIRSYKDAAGVAEAAEEIRRCEGGQFCTEPASALLRLLEAGELPRREADQA